MQQIDRQIEDRFIDLLALVYLSVPWSKMRTSKNVWDIWNHRVRAASTRGTLGEFISRLCNQLGLQSVPAQAVTLIEQLRPHEDALLTLAYRERIYVSMRAALQARQMRAGSRKVNADDDHNTKWLD
jgi:hypothetical protein